MALTLAIETSCDETAVALFDTEKGVIKDLVASQAKLHAPFGGVVPELSAREHVKNISPLLEELFFNTGLTYKDLDFVSFTLTPGLIFIFGGRRGGSQGYSPLQGYSLGSRSPSGGSHLFGLFNPQSGISLYIPHSFGRSHRTLFGGRFW
jgi:hypothetical protein